MAEEKKTNEIIITYSSSDNEVENHIGENDSECQSDKNSPDSSPKIAPMHTEKLAKMSFHKVNLYLMLVILGCNHRRIFYRL